MIRYLNSGFIGQPFLFMFTLLILFDNVHQTDSISCGEVHFQKFSLSFIFSIFCIDIVFGRHQRFILHLLC